MYAAWRERALRVVTDCVCLQLTRLNLAYNSIGEEGIKVLADALLANTNLHFLDIRGNKVEREREREKERERERERVCERETETDREQGSSFRV